MPDHDQFSDELRSLAQLGEEHAGDGWTADRVRRVGTQRRHRRTIITVVAASVAAVTLGGGVVFSAAMRTGADQPVPAQTPTATATDLPTTAPSTTNEPAPPSLTTQNLLQTSDIRTDTAEQQVLITATDLGRRVDQSSVCLTDGLKPLGASELLSRNFRIPYPDEPKKPSAENPLARQPTIYTQALQFADAAAARDAYEQYQAWVEDCDTALKQQKYTRLGTPSSDWIDVRTGVAKTEGRFYEFTYRRPGDNPTYGAWFEAIGLTLAGDRMMVTISLLYGQDKDNVSYRQTPAEPDLASPHEQFGFIIAAAKRLGS